MTGKQHYEEALRQLDLSVLAEDQAESDYAVAVAQVHATLALVWQAGWRP